MNFFHILISAIVLRQWKVYLELLQFRCPNRIVFLKMGCKRYGSNHYAKLIRVQNANVFCHFVWFIYLWVENETLWKDTYIFERITFTLQIFRNRGKKWYAVSLFTKITISGSTSFPAKSKTGTYGPSFVCDT